MLDVVPVVDEIGSHPGLYLYTGFSGHGIGCGSGTGKVMANKILGNNSEFGVDRFR
jgi:glycine/D-amino acid oxidase-like deaminating enzyme